MSRPDDEDPRRASGAGPRGQEQPNSSDSAENARERLAKANTNAALIGLDLRQLDDGAFRVVLIGTGRVITLESLEKVERLLYGCAMGLALIVEMMLPDAPSRPR
jgi:hypothetical protein